MGFGSTRNLKINFYNPYTQEIFLNSQGCADLMRRPAYNIALPQSGRTEVKSTSLSYCSSAPGGQICNQLLWLGGKFVPLIAASPGGHSIKCPACGNAPVMHYAEYALRLTKKNQQQIIFHLQFSRVRLVYSDGQFNCSLIIRNFLLIYIVRLDCHLHSCFFTCLAVGTDA